SKTKQAVDAVTAVLQGLAAKDFGQAAVGLASPYLNEQIKHHTTNADGSINTEANLLAHALLGAVEAQLTGNNALAGAVAGAGGEAAAMVITNILYPNKTNDQLTEAEKKNITFLSQLAGGLASGLVGDSTQAVASGADIAKRAVENNYLAEWQKEKQEKELKECDGNTTCEVKTKLYWGLVDVGQDASFASGVVLGVPENIVESAAGLLSMVTSPVETIMAFKELLARDDTISHIANMTKQSYLDKLDKMQTYYEKAGAEGSFKAGKEIGNIVADVATAFTGAGAVIKTGAGVGAKIISKAGKEIEIPNLTKNRTNIGTCSFRGDMEVKTDKGYQPISSIKVGDKVYAKNELTGELRYQKVLAQYHNPYDFTVYVETVDETGKKQTIVSNKIHPFFAQVPVGEPLTPSSEG
ncbi:VENN motif pre-toxin domain-containing protein, partial [Ursidibacter sp. B-7004-1]